MGEPAVQFEGVSKRFRMGSGHDSLRDCLAAMARRLVGRGGAGDGRGSFWALRDVNFAVESGEAVGIIGPNGAGKSTALKLIAGILRPNEGRVSIRGRLAALIEVGAGFHGDLTGRENIFLNGAILGMTRAEIRAKLDDIVGFAGLERFMDMPVKRYSSGMYARLGFSIASHIDPDVLLVDEVLSVGDAVFRLRCMERMQQLVTHGTTLIFVTHNLEQMQSICRRAVVLDGGRVSFSGPARQAVAHYLQAMSRVYMDHSTDLSTDETGQRGAVELVAFRFVDQSGQDVVWTRSHQPIRAELTIRTQRPIRRLVVEFNMRGNPSENLLSVNSGRDGITINEEAGVHRVSLSLESLPVCGGQYFWNVRAWDAERGTTELDTPFQHPLVIDDDGRAAGTICVARSWSVNGHAAIGSVASVPTATAGSTPVKETRHAPVHLR